MSSDRLLQRFLRYVQVDTTAREDAGVYPSSPGQLELGRLLVAELESMGCTAIEQDQYGLIYASLPDPSDPEAPTIAFNSHLDTSPETTGAGVQPQVVRDYQGGDIALPDGAHVIRVQDNPELQELLGATLITTDGRTLLGGDDKAGIAIIMEFAERMLEQTQRRRGPVRLLFTCDEEIGHGVDHVDLAKLGAQVAYTLDGGGHGDIDVETFSADLAEVVVRGVNIHPSIAKDRMVNALRVAAAFVAGLPRDQAPESTADDQGFLHPYAIEGGVAEVKLRIILRDFRTDALSVQADALRALARDVEQEYPGSQIEIRVRPQYRNLGDGLAAEPRAVALAEQAFGALGKPCRKTRIRGGTDGSLLTEKGLPTPNLSSGQHNPHSPLEWACLDEMEAAVQVLIELAAGWAAQR